MTEIVPDLYHTTAPPAESEARPITKGVWADIEMNLSNPWGRVELLADGYRVTACVERAKTLTWKVVIYVDGTILFAWTTQDRDETRKFWCRSERYLHKAAHRKAMEKYLKSKDSFMREMAEAAYKKIVTFSPIWSSGKAFIRHLKKSCTDIRLINIGY